MLTTIIINHTTHFGSVDPNIHHRIDHTIHLYLENNNSMHNDDRPPYSL